MCSPGTDRGSGGWVGVPVDCLPIDKIITARNPSYDWSPLKHSEGDLAARRPEVEAFFLLQLQLFYLMSSWSGLGNLF